MFPGIKSQGQKKVSFSNYHSHATILCNENLFYQKFRTLFQCKWSKGIFKWQREKKGIFAVVDISSWDENGIKMTADVNKFQIWLLVMKICKPEIYDSIPIWMKQRNLWVTKGKKGIFCSCNLSRCDEDEIKTTADVEKFKIFLDVLKSLWLEI